MKALRSGASAVIMAAVLNGCHSHVALSAPPPAAPQSVRVSAYEKLHSLSYHETQVTYFQSGIPVGSQHTNDYMQLANGTRVYYPEDVIPVVGADSVTGKAAEASQSKRSTAVYLGLAAAASLVAGLAVGFSSLGSTNEFGEPNHTPVFLGFGLGLLGGLGFGYASHAVMESSQDDAATAYETYNDNLAQRLRLVRPPEVERPAPRPEANARQRPNPWLPATQGANSSTY